jgi:hypothetical protein
MGRARRWYQDPSWRSELQMVKNVEEFRPEIKPHPFSVGQDKVFDQCEVRVDEIRTAVEVNPQLTGWLGSGDLRAEVRVCLTRLGRCSTNVNSHPVWSI